jgi:hypothetical protein
MMRSGSWQIHLLNEFWRAQMKKLKISGIFVLSFLFVIVMSAQAQTNWLNPALRVDLGSIAGTSASEFPCIACWGDNNVYIAWEDTRDADYGIYFNYSYNAGMTWQTPDIRLDTGDVGNGNQSSFAQVACSGSNVYAVWTDWRNGQEDVYFNYSSNSGVTWQTPDMRIDSDNSTSAFLPTIQPQIACSGTNVYIVWGDDRNGSRDIYLDYSTDGGANWQASDIRIDTGDVLGDNNSWNPQIACVGNNVYVVWEDERNSGILDIYFNYSTDGGANWQASAIRLDTGVDPGTQGSTNPQISAVDNNVYVVWEDRRNGNRDIYFNRSSDGGVNWLSSAIRLDTGDTAGDNSSWNPQIACVKNFVYVTWCDWRDGDGDIYINYSNSSGATWQTPDIQIDSGDASATYTYAPQIACTKKKAYVVWHDFRNGGFEQDADIYFNFSLNGGANWQASDIRIDLGDAAGAERSWWPQIACSDDSVYSVWQDQRSGGMDIFFNSSALPHPDIKANGSDGPLAITRSETLTVTVEIDAGTHTGENCDWWVVMDTPLGRYYYDLTQGWLPGLQVTRQGALKDISPKIILNQSGLPKGEYAVYFGVDMVVNGTVDQSRIHYDRVLVTINP